MRLRPWAGPAGVGNVKEEAGLEVEWEEPVEEVVPEVKKAE